MNITEPNVHGAKDSGARREDQLIQEFLRSREIDAARLRALPFDDRQRVLAEASAYATNKLAAIEARAHFVHELHREECGQ